MVNDWLDELIVQMIHLQTTGLNRRALVLQQFNQ